jgi:RHS repeat-associated protein
VNIGKNVGGSYYFNGGIDEIMIYNRALGASEIASMAGASAQATFTDGLGRMIQSHANEGTTSLVSAVQYDGRGTAYRSYRTYRQTGNGYDPSFTTNAATQLGSSKPYTERFLYSDPLGRDSLTTIVDRQTANEDIRYYYGATQIAGQTFRTADRWHRKSSLLPWMVDRSYVDNLGRQIYRAAFDSSRTDSIGSRTLYTVFGQPFVQYAPKGDSTRITRDFLGRTIVEKSADRGTSRIVYDKAGRPRFMVDSTGSAQSPDNILYWKYDVFGRVVENGYMAGPDWSVSYYQRKADSSAAYPATPATWRTKYVYDQAGRTILSQTNSDGLTDVEVEDSLVYDLYSRATAKRQKMFDFSSTPQVTTYTYELTGRVKQVDYPASAYGNLSVGYSYDALNRVTSIYIPGSSVFASYSYDSLGQILTETINPGGTAQQRAFSWYKAGYLKAITNSLFSDTLSTSGGVNAGEVFYHGMYGSVRGKYGSFTPAPPTTTVNYQMKYDMHGRMKAAAHTYGTSWSIGANSDTQYDKNGNITQMQVGSGSAWNYSYATGTNRPSSINGWSYSTDQTGNVTSSGTSGTTTSLGYDPLTRMTNSVSQGSRRKYFQYDNSGERAFERDSAGSIVTTAYLRGVGPLPIVHKLSTSEERTYVHGPTGLIAVRNGASWYFVLRDHLGSTRLVVNTSGAVQDRFEYNPYGDLLNGQINTPMPYRFTGQENDDEVALYSYRARMYDSKIGLFLAPDPARQTWTSYGYALGDPLRLSDPTGREATDVSFGYAAFEAQRLAILQRQAQEYELYLSQVGSWGEGGAGWGVTETETALYRLQRSNLVGSYYVHANGTVYRVVQYTVPSENRQSSTLAANSGGGTQDSDLPAGSSSSPITRIVFNGSRLVVYNGNGDIVNRMPATSGDGEGDESVKNHGPIPRGLYVLDPSEITESNIFRELLGDWGNYRAPLHPSLDTDTYGRDGFFIHGGRLPGSAGCIDVGYYDNYLFPPLQRQSQLVLVRVVY